MAASNTSFQRRELEMMVALDERYQTRLVFDEKAHAYFLDGKPMIGVTSVLKVINKPALIQWAANMAVDYLEKWLEDHDYDATSTEEKGVLFSTARTNHTKKKEDAGSKGTAVHAEIEKYIKLMISDQDGQAFLMNGYEHKQVQKFVEWANTNNVRFLASEKRLYSEEHWYAGTADFVCEKDGKLYVGDVKTSSAIYPEHFIQASAYAHALTEMGEYKDFGGVVIVNIPKKGGLKVQENYDLKGNFECFKAALTLHKYLNAHA